MKKIGIVGGVSWRSTVDYYAEICRRSEQWQLARNPQSVPAIPEMSVESLDLNKAVSYLGVDGDEESWVSFDEYHRSALQRVEASGANFALIASNTPHHRFEQIVRGVRIPVLDIFEVAAKETARTGAKRALILGTALTMRSNRLQREFAKYGVEAAGPADEKAILMTTRLIEDLQLGRRLGAAEQLQTIARTLCERQARSRPVVCLACTELPSAFQRLEIHPTFEVNGVLYVDTTAAHSNAAVDLAVDVGN